MRFGDGGAEIALAHAIFQRNEALAVLAVDIGGARLHLHRAEIGEANIGGRALAVAAGQGDRDRLDRFDVATIFGTKAHGEAEIHLALINARHLLTTHGSLNNRVHISNGETIAGRLHAVDLDEQIGLAEQIER